MRACMCIYVYIYMYVRVRITQGQYLNGHEMSELHLSSGQEMAVQVNYALSGTARWASEILPSHRARSETESRRLSESRMAFISRFAYLRNYLTEKYTTQ